MPMVRLSTRRGGCFSSSISSHGKRQPVQMAVVELKRLVQALFAVAHVRREGETPAFVIEQQGNFGSARRGRIQSDDTGPLHTAGPFELFLLFQAGHFSYPRGTG